MRITFEVDDEKIPHPFKNPDVIFAFLHDNLYVQNLNKAEDNIAHKEYRKVFFDKQNLNGQEWIDTIEQQDDAKINFAKLLLDSIKMEEKNTDVPSSLDVVEVEKWAINKALIQTNGNIKNSAELLGISRDTLYAKIKKFDINVKKSLEMSRE